MVLVPHHIVVVGVAVGLEGSLHLLAAQVVVYPVDHMAHTVAVGVAAEVAVAAVNCMTGGGKKIEARYFQKEDK